MNHFKRIYHEEAAAYHRMIAAEDTHGQLKSTLRGWINAHEQALGRPVHLLDVGSGTGRFALMLGDLCATFASVDYHAPMLIEQRQHATPSISIQLIQADARALPLPGDRFDFSIAGWALGHMVGWEGEDWPNEIDRAISELRRLTRPGGQIVICETLTTGSTMPAPPTPGLADYYDRLESVHRFKRTTLATDYRYQSVEEAVERLDFFFGEGLTESIRSNEWATVPEWTGVWRAEA